MIEFTVDRDDWTWAIDRIQQRIELRRNGKLYLTINPSPEQWAALGMIADDITDRSYRETIRKLASGED